MANVGTIPGSERLPNAIGGTMATVFPYVYRWRIGGFNELVVGFDRPVSQAQLRARLDGAPPKLQPAARLAQTLKRQAPSTDPLTDDKAPVEWLTDQLIVRYAGGP